MHEHDRIQVSLLLIFKNTPYLSAAAAAYARARTHARTHVRDEKIISLRWIPRSAIKWSLPMICALLDLKARTQGNLSRATAGGNYIDRYSIILAVYPNSRSLYRTPYAMRYCKYINIYIYMYHAMYRRSAPYRQQYTALDKSRYCHPAVAPRDMQSLGWRDEFLCNSVGWQEYVLKSMNTISVPRPGYIKSIDRRYIDRHARA